MKRIMYSIIFCLFFVSGCKTTKTVLPVIQGMIYDGNNESVSDVEIFISNKKTAISDIYGHFTLSALEVGKTYELNAKKKGYEEVSMNFSYTNPSQVIYLRMYSASELINLAENMVGQKKYKEAQALLNRAEEADGSYLSINYLRAIMCVLNNDYENALKITNEIVAAGYVDSYIYLLMADIYRDGYSDIENEQVYLEKSLNLSYDPLVKNRLHKK